MRASCLILAALLAGLAAASCNCDAVPVAPTPGDGNPARDPHVEVLWSPAEGILPFPDASLTRPQTNWMTWCASCRCSMESRSLTTDTPRTQHYMLRDGCNAPKAAYTCLLKCLL